MSDYDLILDYVLDNDAIPEDFKRVVNRWIVEHSDDPELVAAMRNVWERELAHNTENMDIAGLARVMDQVDSEWHKSELSAYIAEREESREVEKERGKEREGSYFYRRIKMQWRYVAVIAGVIIFILAAYLAGNLMQDDKTVLITANGSTGVFNLPDGSKVRLNGGSKLTYSADDLKKGSIRDVALEGEAFFEVAHDRNRPFRVDISGISIEVLGTTFDVKNYEHSPLKEVVLMSGKVRIRENVGERSTFELTPDQRYVYHSYEGKSGVEEVNAAAYCSWYLDKYKIQNEPLRKVLIALSRKYCMDLDIAEDVDTDRAISLTITNEPLENVMGTITYVAGLEYDISDNTLHIRNSELTNE